MSVSFQQSFADWEAWLAPNMRHREQGWMAERELVAGRASCTLQGDKQHRGLALWSCQCCRVSPGGQGALGDVTMLGDTNRASQSDSHLSGCSIPALLVSAAPPCAKPRVTSFSQALYSTKREQGKEGLRKQLLPVPTGLSLM